MASKKREMGPAVCSWAALETARPCSSARSEKGPNGAEGSSQVQAPRSPALSRSLAAAARHRCRRRLRRRSSSQKLGGARGQLAGPGARAAYCPRSVARTDPHAPRERSGRPPALGARREKRPEEGAREQQQPPPRPPTGRLCDRPHSGAPRTDTRSKRAAGHSIMRGVAPVAAGDGARAG